MEQSERTYSRAELEQLLADYAFGQLQPEEGQRVERSLQLYPDLAAEVELLRHVFARLDELEPMRSLEQRSRNLSVQVLQRWQREGARQPWRWVRLLLPAAGLGLLLWLGLRPPHPEPPEHHLPPSETAQQAELLPEMLPLSDGLLTFAQWSAGIPPVARPPGTALPVALPAASAADSLWQTLLLELEALDAEAAAP